MMKQKKPYSPWVGVVMGFFLSGSAHFLSGRRRAGLFWFLGLFGGFFISRLLLLFPGTFPVVLSILALLVTFCLWIWMLKQSVRPVPRIGLLGWLAFLFSCFLLNASQSLIIAQCFPTMQVKGNAMAPTLYGVHADQEPVLSGEKPGFIQWWVYGEKYTEIKSQTSGILKGSGDTCLIGSQIHRLPTFARPFKQSGEKVLAGETLWSGISIANDHILVDRLTYHFSKPKRGDIVVFRMDGLPGRKQSQVLVKRIAGLPGERVQIDPPFLVVNGEKVVYPEVFEMIAKKQDGFAGFALSVQTPSFDCPLKSVDDELSLKSDEYFVLGDNNPHSLDSRYFGPVKRKNIIGKVARVYWPLSRMNALAEE